MKRLLGLMMIFVMLLGTTAFAKDNKDTDKVKLRANGE